MTFFVFSLPRSGSAWLSMFLSGWDSYCYHEPLLEFGSITGMSERFTRRPEFCVGGVDTLAYFESKTLQATCTTWEFFVLERDPDEIQRSTDKCGVKGYDAHKESRALKAATTGLTVIHHNRLSELEYLQWVWQTVVGPAFDAERAAALIEMRIERDIKRFAARHPILGSVFS